MATTALAQAAEILDDGKFRDPEVTATGERRASVSLGDLKTLWFNTGTLCNLSCAHCYMESSPRNDRLVYLRAEEAALYLEEIADEGLATAEIGFTGGEPFMNPDIIAMIEDALGRGHRVLVLTDAMRPMMRRAAELLEIKERHGESLALRVSLDHYTAESHERERGPRSWDVALMGLKWLSDNGFHVHVAGRTCWDEREARLRAGYARLFADEAIRVEAGNPTALVLFPEMNGASDVPEITESCWDVLGVSPNDVMCATSRMVVKRRGAEKPAVIACTLLPYDPQFELGETLVEASGAVQLNHRHCAKFCVLGGASCGVA